LILVKLVRYRS